MIDLPAIQGDAALPLAVRDLASRLAEGPAGDDLPTFIGQLDAGALAELAGLAHLVMHAVDEGETEASLAAARALTVAAELVAAGEQMPDPHPKFAEAEHTARVSGLVTILLLESEWRTDPGRPLVPTLDAMVEATLDERD